MLQAVIYARVSTQDQDCARQIRDLREFAERAGYTITGEYIEKASGMKKDREERAKIIALARQRKIGAVLVTEMTRWGRSMQDLIETLQELRHYGVSIVAQTGVQFDLSTAQGKMIASVLSALAEFERDLIAERTRSGLAAAKARGKKLGRQQGQNPSDKYRKQVLALTDEGRSVRWIADELHISPTTVQAIRRRNAG